MGKVRPGLLAVLFACGCAAVRPETGLSLAEGIGGTVESAHRAVAAGDTTRALAALERAARRAATSPGRDLIHGHLGALEAEGYLLAELAALRAATGDTTGARVAFDRLLFEGGFSELLDSLERSPRYAALRALPDVARWRALFVMRRRTWRDSAFVSPWRDTLPVQERLASVALLWSEARTSFVGLGTQGTRNWDSVFQATLVRVAGPMDSWEFYQEVERMLYALDDDHTDVMQLPRELRHHRASAPLDARRVEGHVLLTGVRSPTLAALGLRPGQEVLLIDGLTPEAHAAAHIPPQLGVATPQARETATFGWQLWLGDSGTSFRLHLRDPDGNEHDVSVRRGRYTDAVAVPLVEARLLDGGIGYLALNSFSAPGVAALIDSAMRVLGPIRGLIVDTRRNSGGSQDAGWHLLAQFITRPYVQIEQYSSAYVGIWRAWGGSAPKVPLPERILRPDTLVHRTYPLLWLIGPRTASAAEGVAALAEQTGAATTVGELTFGSTGQPILIPLPGGGMARIRVEEERFNDGRIYTQRGITPQVPVRVTADGIRAGRDEVLEGAIALMRRRLGVLR